MKGYLLDSNAISRWFSGNEKVKARAEAASPNDQIRTSVVTLGELRFGHERTATTDQERRDEYERWFKEKFPDPLEVTKHTTEFYGILRAKVFEMFPPLGQNENHPERCYDRVNACELGIDENDLWLAAQAIERGFILVTNDRMKPIKAAADALAARVPWRLQMEDWES